MTTNSVSSERVRDMARRKAAAAVVDPVSAAVVTTARVAGVSATAGKYLTFRIGPEIYALEILKVQEIIGMMDVTRVPRMPDSVRGVVNLRGRVIPVVDLRVRFVAKEIADTEVTCIIVVQIAYDDISTTMGIIVDEVREVEDIRDDQIALTPEFGIAVDTAFLKGVAVIEHGVTLILDIDRVLTEDEVAVIHENGADA